MRPTFNAEVTHAGQKHAGDIVVLNKWTPGMRRYTAGDVVTLTDPDRSDLELTKRIMALEGDVVAVHGAGPHSDQRILAALQGWENKDGKRTAFICVPPGHAWVEGDASLLDLDKAGPAVRDQSRDSRTFGPVPLGLVNARVDWILWPLSRFGRPAKRAGMRQPQIPDSVEYGPASAPVRTRQDLVTSPQTQLLQARQRELAEDNATKLMSQTR